MKGLVNQIALVVAAVLVLATLLLAIFNDKGVIQVRDQSQRLSTIQTDVSTIQAGNKALNDEIHALRTDPSAIERIAREELKLVKPNEVVLVTPTEPAPPPPQR